LIEMRHESGDDGGVTAPIVTCDSCREEITDCRSANLLWLREEPARQYHTHKSCNRRLESSLARSRGREYLHFLWMPLDHFLDFVGHNAGLRQARAARREREALTSYMRRKAR
jgi:hypothetical protein